MRKYILSDGENVVLGQSQTGRNPFAKKNRIFALSLDVIFDT